MIYTMKSVIEHKNSCKHLLKKIRQSSNPNPNPMGLTSQGKRQPPPLKLLAQSIIQGNQKSTKSNKTALDSKG